MIIVCPECSTKFDVNADRIPDAGAKVRCARCKNVFTAYKEPDVELIEDNGDDFVEEEGTPAVETSENTTEDTDFSYDKFQELDSEEPAAEESNDDFSYADLAKELASEGKQNAAAETAEENAENNCEATTDVAEPEFPNQPASVKKGGPLASIIRILLTLILIIMIAVGIFIYQNGTEQLEQTIKQIIGQQTSAPVQTGQVNIDNWEGKFVLNKKAGELFLIRGEAINNFTEARAAIQVKGVVFDQNGKPLRQKTVFCGNAISDKDLLSLSFPELEKMMGNQFGKALSNMKINSKQRIPFDIVFNELPKNLSEFSVIVTSSQPATK